MSGKVKIRLTLPEPVRADYIDAVRDGATPTSKIRIKNGERDESFHMMIEGTAEIDVLTGILTIEFEGEMPETVQ